MVGDRAFAGDLGDLCQTFRYLALDTNRWLTLSRPDLVPNEISITDRNLMLLRLHHPGRVLVRRFAVRDESLNGADWEWWLGSHGRWAGMRVQAKKLDANGDRYVNLRHEVGDPPRRQIDILRRDAQRVGLPAAYVLYNGDSLARASWGPSPCGHQEVRLRGCAIAGAGRVESVLNGGSDRLAEVAPISLPWSDLVCCGGGQDLAAHVGGLMAALGEDAIGRRDVLPPYAQALLSGEPHTERGVPVLAGVVVVMERPDSDG